MFRTMLPLSIIAVCAVGHPGVATARGDTDSGCDAAIAVVRDYAKDGENMVLTGAPFGPEHPLSELEKNWRITPPLTLLETYRSRAASSILDGCASRRADIQALGIELDPATWKTRPELVAAIQVGVAVLDSTGSEALVQSSASFRGFGGHCLLSYLRRQNGEWKIVDQRAICVV